MPLSMQRIEAEGLTIYMKTGMVIISNEDERWPEEVTFSIDSIDEMIAALEAIRPRPEPQQMTDKEFVEFFEDTKAKDAKKAKAAKARKVARVIKAAREAAAAAALRTGS